MLSTAGPSTVGTIHELNVSVPASRLADLERVAAAASAWLRAWETAQATAKTLTAFESSKQLAAVVRSIDG